MTAVVDDASGADQHLSDLLEHAIRTRPHHVAVCDERLSLTYTHLGERVQRLANGLRSGLGLARGERFAILATNRAEFAEVYFAAASAGLVCVPINYRLAAPEMTRILGDSGARAVLSERGLEEKAVQIQDEGFDGELVWMEEEPEVGAYEQLLASAGVGGRREAHTGMDTVLQIYTSGTTGLPKGVMLSNRNLVANSWHMLAEQTTVRGDRHLSTAPMCHLGAGSRIFLNVHAGATNVIRARFDAEAAIQAFATEEANTALVVPSMLRPMLDVATESGVSLRGKVRLLVYGAEPMPLEILAESLEKLGCDFQGNYGLTESGPNLTILPPEDHTPHGTETNSARLASVGRETVGVRVRVVDDDDNDVKPGEVGELIACGDNVMEGYWNMPTATAETLRGGWLRTGDLATVDDDNYLYLAGRKKDMLISGGFNVYPLEIERVLESHADVAEIAVVSMPHERWGEVPAAFVVQDPGRPESEVEQELRRLSSDRLAPFKAPKEYRFVDELPRNAGGKVLKQELAERLSR